MNIIHKQAASPQAKIVLDALINAVSSSLKQKQKLGQYAVIWDGKKPVKKIDFFDSVKHDL